MCLQRERERERKLEYRVTWTRIKLIILKESRFVALLVLVVVFEEEEGNKKKEVFEQKKGI